MNIRQKDLVLLPYPFSNLEHVKVRPAIVVSNDEFNRNCNDLIAVPLTSVIKDEPYSMIIAQRDLKNGNLVKTSRARLDKVFSVEKRLVQMKIGSMSDSSFAKIRKEIINNF